MWILEAKFFFSLSNIDMHLAGGGVSCSSCFSFLFFGSLLLIMSEYLSLIMVLYMFMLVWMLRK